MKSRVSHLLRCNNIISPSQPIRQHSLAMSTVKTSHLERTAAEPRAKELYDVKLARVDQVNERVRLFRLELLSGPTTFIAGQWLDTFVPDTPKAGGFTITSPPSAARREQNPYLELAVQESPENAPAAWLWRPMSDILDATLRVRIGGSFVFPPLGDVGPVKRVVLVAGGVGVNPLMSVLSYIGERTEDGLEVKMAYGSKVPARGAGDIVFMDRIADLFREKKVKGSVDLFVTGGEAAGKEELEGKGVDVYSRRMLLRDVEGLVTSDGGDIDSTIVYICGPPAMTDEFSAGLISQDGLGMQPGRVMTEKWW